MFTVIWSIFAFLLTAAIVVTFHEFGHFWVARRLGMKVLCFSVGFGRVLWQREDSTGTIIQICALPFGGYVKLLESHQEEPIPPELEPYVFDKQPLIARTAVVLAGPVFNILMAIAFYWLVYLIGMDTVMPVVGSVMPQSPAAEAGIQASEEILSIDGKPTPGWQEVSMALVQHMGDNAAVSMQLRNLHDDISRTANVVVKEWQQQDGAPMPLESVGIQPFMPSIPPLIANVADNSAASLAGIQAQDQITAIDGKKITQWQDISVVLESLPEKDLVISLKRGEKLLNLTVHPTEYRTNAHKKRVPILGIQSTLIHWPPSQLHTIRYSVGAAGIKAVQETWQMFSLTGQLLYKLVTGVISPRSLSGAVGIAERAGVAVEIGFVYYLQFLALISVSIAFLNLLPIPMLDGGHLMYYVFEFILRRPVSLQVRAIGHQIGGFIIIAVMMLALINDVSRLGLF